MSVKNQVYESVWSDRWCLAGTLTTSAQVMPASRSLTLIRSFDSLSPAIRSAMSAKSVIPMVEINTPTHTVTLLNAQVVNIAPAAIEGNIVSAVPKGWIDIDSWSFGASRSGSVGNANGGSGAGKVSFGDLDVGKNRSVEISFSFEKFLAGIQHRPH